MPKYDIDVQLTGTDGNAFAILAKMQRAMRNAGIPAADINTFINDATEGDYNHLLRTCGEYANIS